MLASRWLIGPEAVKAEASLAMSETTPIPIAMALAISLAAGILVYVNETPKNSADPSSIAATPDSPLSTAVLRAEARTGARAVEAHLAAELGVAAMEVKVIQGGVAEYVVVDGQTGRVDELPDIPRGP
jgi:hypothetical protein